MTPAGNQAEMLEKSLVAMKRPDPIFAQNRSRGIAQLNTPNPGPQPHPSSENHQLGAASRPPYARAQSNSEGRNALLTTAAGIDEL